MGSLDELAAELESMHELNQEEADDAPVVPAGFDVVTPRPEAVQKLREAGRDPTVTAIRVCPVYRNVRQGQIGKYEPRGLTLEWLRRKLVPGTYDLIAVNQDNCWVGSRRYHVADADTISAEPAPSNGNGNGNGNGGSMGDRLLYELAMRGLNGNPDRSSEMEKATAAMVKSMVAMSQMQAVELKQRMMLMDREDNKRSNADNNALNLIKTILPLVQSKRSNGNGSSSAQFGELIQAMQLGAQFSGAMAGNNPAPEPTDLERWLLPLAETLGPGLVSVFAMMLPPDQRKMASDLLEQHFRTREAEARAATEPSDNPPTVDATGETVGGDD